MPLAVVRACACCPRQAAVWRRVPNAEGTWGLLFPLSRSAEMIVRAQLSLSRGDKWDPSPSDETVDLISSLDRPAFDVLDYVNWCRFLDKDLKKKIAAADD